MNWPVIPGQGSLSIVFHCTALRREISSEITVVDSELVYGVFNELGLVPLALRAAVSLRRSRGLASTWFSTRCSCLRSC